MEIYKHNFNLLVVQTLWDANSVFPLNVSFSFFYWFPTEEKVKWEQSERERRAMEEQQKVLERQMADRQRTQEENMKQINEKMERDKIQAAAEHEKLMAVSEYYMNTNVCLGTKDIHPFGSTPGSFHF